MRDYLFEVGDPVKINAKVSLNGDRLHDCIINAWLNKESVVTARDKGFLGNQYELTDVETGYSIAWIYEVQLTKEELYPCGNPNCNSDEKLHKEENMNDAPYDINVRICDSCMEDC